MTEHNIRLNFKYPKYDGIQHIEVYEDNKLRMKFIYDEDVKTLRNPSTQKRANEECIRYYYQNMSKEEYKPLNFNQATQEISNLRDKPSNVVGKKSKQFKNGNSIIFTNKRNIDYFDFTYINVRVKVYFDGHHVIARGRSDYKYSSQIKNSEVSYFISQAVIRAIAPYGSNLKFKPLSWSYAYHISK